VKSDLPDRQDPFALPDSGQRARDFREPIQMRGRRDLFSGIKRVRWFKTRERKYSACQFTKISISLADPAFNLGGAFRERHDT
jgi:hypothetical protein